MSTLTVPVWLLDVDGVINATKPGWSAPPRQGYASSLGTAWKLRWAPGLIARIRGLLDTGRVEVVWSTTWCGDTSELESTFGLPALPSAFEVPSGGYVGDVKLAAARSVLDQGRRLIWTDDMETPVDGPLHDELTADGRALLIRPAPNRGLQSADLDAIEAFTKLIHPAVS